MVSYLFRNVRCPALGLANRKSSVRRAQYRLQSDLGAFAPAALGKFCPVSSHCWLAIVTQAPFQVSFHQRGLLWSPHLKRPLYTFVLSLFYFAICPSSESIKFAYVRT